MAHKVKTGVGKCTRVECHVFQHTSIVVKFMNSENSGVQNVLTLHTNVPKCFFTSVEYVENNLTQNSCRLVNRLALRVSSHTAHSYQLTPENMFCVKFNLYTAYQR